MARRAVVVVGSGLAGLAAAARLAKLGHPVTVLERTGRLGGRWAAEPYADQLVDRNPAIIGFPAPWRDLFRKSGRPLEAELARLGCALVPAPPARYVFADGSELKLPTDRGAQLEVLTSRYSPAVAEAWRDLLDRLDDVWQTIRPLGLEAELRGRHQVDRSVRAGLWARRSIADLAAGMPHPELAALIRSIAYRLGSVPESTPAWCAVGLAVERTFGRWSVSAVDGTGAGRTSLLIDALTARLALRGVETRLNCAVASIAVADGRVAGVVTAAGEAVAADAVICTTDPWQTATALLPRPAARRLRRRIRQLRPALTPAITHHLSAEPARGVGETVRLSASGLPTITYRRPADTRSLISVHDYHRLSPDPSAGAAWQGFRSWQRRPPVTSEVPGLFLAGPWSPAGAGLSEVVLSGALAAYGCAGYLE